MTGKLSDTIYIVVISLALASLCESARKSPRIYNVLISTKKNLAPSQALPVYEPVLRTTSVGLAFSPLIYTPISTIQSSPTRYVHEGPVVQDIIGNQNQPSEQPKQSFAETEQNIEARSNQLQPASTGGIKNLPQNVVPLQQYIPYYTSPQLTYEPYYPKPEQKVQENIPTKALEEYLENVNDPKQIIANLKKNSDIPDVPPPPLPVRNL
ncbi:uncharacterized protein LOC108906246 [Anoplophora glabripennis]|uniref:uncharacterized protein LOC108906246 n=1 Tax=Anoplophora glabripennis TaxID=217634 RepID=UPI000874F250|nr:uncharacterized protein LOC108906246 [Anoplophora glabripennis]